MSENDKQNILASFKAMIDTEDDGLAFQFLENNNWDLNQAYDQYIPHAFSDNEPNNIPPPASNSPAHNIPDVEMDGEDVSAFEEFSSVDTPQMNIPEPVQEPVQESNHPPASGLQNMFEGVRNLPMNIANSIGGVFNPNTHNDQNMGTGMENNMNTEELKTPSQEFLMFFRKKNGTHIPLPKFVNNTVEEIKQESMRLKRPVFLYLHNNRGDSCSIVDQSVIGNEITLELLSKYI